MKNRDNFNLKKREAQRKCRQKRFNIKQQQLIQENKFVSPNYLLYLYQYVDAKRKEHKLPKTYFYARLFPKDNEVQAHIIGDMNEKCEYCSAKLFAEEVRDNTATLCSHKGKVKLESIKVCKELQKLVEQNNEYTKNYSENIKQFNNALAFASVQVNSVDIPGKGPYCFKVHGQVYHMVGSLQPPEGIAPSYAGLFILDFDTALQYRTENKLNKKCCKEIMVTLQTMLDTHNPYAQLFKSIKDVAVSVPDF